MQEAPGPQREERARVFAAIACAAALLIGLALPTLRGQLYLDSDLGDFYVPVRAFLHGEGHAGLFHPLVWAGVAFVRSGRQRASALEIAAEAVRGPEQVQARP